MQPSLKLAAALGAVALLLGAGMWYVATSATRGLPKLSPGATPATRSLRRPATPVTRGAPRRAPPFVPPTGMLPAPPAAPTPGSRKIDWTPLPVEQALAEARQAGRPVFILFVADCSACLELERKPIRDPRVVAETRRFVALRLRLGDNPELEGKYKIAEAPTLLFLDSGEGAKPRFIQGYAGVFAIYSALHETK